MTRLKLCFARAIVMTTGAVALALLTPSQHSMAAGQWFTLVPRYSLTEVELSSPARASVLTDSEVVAGRACYPGIGCHAFYYKDGNVRDLGTLGGHDSWAHGANDRGQVVGDSETGQSSIGGFLYQDGVLQDFGALVGMLATAHGINKQGQVTGGATTSDFYTHAYVYNDGVVHDLGTLGGSWSEGLAINDRGNVTGYSATSDQNVRAFIYRDGVMEDIGTLGCCNSLGSDINERGDVTGQSAGIDSEGNFFADHAFLYSNGVMRDLGTLGGYFSIGSAVNDSRQVTGNSITEHGEYHAFLYVNGAMHDLNDLIESDDPLRLHVTLYEGADINDHGVIVANGRNTQTGQDMVYVLRPVNNGGGGSIDWQTICLLALFVAWSTYSGFMARRHGQAYC